MAQSQALAQALVTGGPTGVAVAQAAGEAYSKQPTAVTNTLAAAIVQANGNSTQVDAAARVIAKALAAGGDQASVFANALGAAVKTGGCSAVNNILSRECAVWGLGFGRGVGVWAGVASGGVWGGVK